MLTSNTYPFRSRAPARVPTVIPKPTFPFLLLFVVHNGQKYSFAGKVGGRALRRHACETLHVADAGKFDKCEERKKANYPDIIRYRVDPDVTVIKLTV